MTRAVLAAKLARAARLSAEAVKLCEEVSTELAADEAAPTEATPKPTYSREQAVRDLRRAGFRA